MIVLVRGRSRFDADCNIYRNFHPNRSILSKDIHWQTFSHRQTDTHTHVKLKTSFLGVSVLVESGNVLSSTSNFWRYSFHSFYEHGSKTGPEAVQYCSSILLVTLVCVLSRFFPHVLAHCCENTSVYLQLVYPRPLSTKQWVDIVYLPAYCTRSTTQLLCCRYSGNHL